MIWEQIVNDPTKVQIFNSAVQQLNSINAFGALLDIGSARNGPVASDKPIELSAQRAAWFDGYAECLRDIFLFNDRYVSTPQSEKPAPTFGAAEELLQSGEIDDDEYRTIIADKNSTNS